MEEEALQEMMERHERWEGYTKKSQDYARRIHEATQQLKERWERSPLLAILTFPVHLTRILYLGEREAAYAVKPEEELIHLRR